MRVQPRRIVDMGISKNAKKDVKKATKEAKKDEGKGDEKNLSKKDKFKALLEKWKTKKKGKK
jgi:hypothetical protein